MNFNEFKEKISEDLKQKFYEDGTEVRISNNTVNKLNETYEAVTVTPEDSNIGVNLNISKIYEDMMQGDDYNSALDSAYATIERGIKNTPEIDVDAFRDYSKMKDKLVMEVVSLEANKEMLNDIPHQTIEDMAVVYRFDLGEMADGRSTVLVTNQLMDSMGINKEQLYRDAMENAPILRPVVIKGMTEVIAEMTGMTKDDLVNMGMAPGNGEEMMYVASSTDNIQGAGVIAYQDFMEQAAERAGGDFFILPSSRHEVLIVPDDGTKTLKELEAMVKDVNATQVKPEDKLTDSVYHYDSKNKVFELGEKFVGKKKESVLDDLKNKKDEVLKQPKKESLEANTKSKGGEAI